MKEPIQCSWYSDQVVGWMVWGLICSRGKKLFPSSKHADWLWVLPISQFSCTGDSFIGSKVPGVWSWLIISIQWQNWEWVEMYIYLLTSWCRVLLKKLIGLQLVKKFPAFHGTRRFITARTSVRHLSLSWASPIQSTYPHSTSWRSILILSTHLRLGLPSGLFPSGFPTKTLYTHMRHMPSPSHSSRFYHLHNIEWGVQII